MPRYEQRNLSCGWARNLFELLKVNVLSGFPFCMVSRTGANYVQSIGTLCSPSYIYRACLSNSSFTLHGFRSGAAVSLDRIMNDVGWKSSKKALHYIKLKEVVNPEGTDTYWENIQG